MSASGLPSDRFSFEGFLPSKEKGRLDKLAALKEDPRTLIFYESPHRIVHSLESIAAALGDDREIVMAREVTKTFETFLSGSVAEVLQTVKDDANQQRGEIVLMCHGYRSDEESEFSTVVIDTLKLLCEELPLKKASAIAGQIYGIKKNALYKHGLAIGL